MKGVELIEYRSKPFVLEEMLLYRPSRVAVEDCLGGRVTVWDTLHALPHSTGAEEQYL